MAKASADGIDSNEDKATVDAVQQKTLSLDKSASPATYDSVGDVVSYSYLVRTRAMSVWRARSRLLTIRRR